MLVDWKNKYWRNVNTTQRSPHIICTTNHIAPALFSKLEQAIIKCVWKHKDPNSQSNSEEENQSERHHNARL